MPSSVGSPSHHMNFMIEFARCLRAHSQPKLRWQIPSSTSHNHHRHNKIWTPKRWIRPQTRTRRASRTGRFAWSCANCSNLLCASTQTHTSNNNPKSKNSKQKQQNQNGEGGETWGGGERSRAKARRRIHRRRLEPPERVVGDLQLLPLGNRQRRRPRRPPTRPPLRGIEPPTYNLTHTSYRKILT